MKNKNFTATYIVAQPSKEIFKSIIDVRKWWTGLYGEEITGSSDKLNDEFTFRAGNGAHYSKQKLVELVPGKKIVWLVTESNLSFLNKKDEWTGTKLRFEFTEQANGTEVRFTHLGLVPAIECYDGCSGAWGSYLEKFLSPLEANSKSKSMKK